MASRDRRGCRGRVGLMLSEPAEDSLLCYLPQRQGLQPYTPASSKPVLSCHLLSQSQVAPVPSLGARSLLCLDLAKVQVLDDTPPPM